MTDKTEAGVGHNSGEVSGQRLKSYLERIERLTEDKKALGEDIRDVFSEAKSAGFDPKIMRKQLARRKANKEKLAEEEQLLELYEAAVGVFA